MSNTIDETAKQFTDELFAGDDLTDFDTQTEKNDAYVMCMAFGNHLMEQPLSVRLTAEEKERVRQIHRDYHQKWDCSCNDRESERSFYCFSLLERIFGKEFFEEGE